eukprot:6826554-Lingulodinium_polyedra.AAC.1
MFNGKRPMPDVCFPVMLSSTLGCSCFRIANCPDNSSTNQSSHRLDLKATNSEYLATVLTKDRVRDPIL